MRAAVNQAMSQAESQTVVGIVTMTWVLTLADATATSAQHRVTRGFSAARRRR